MNTINEPQTEADIVSDLIQARMNAKYLLHKFVLAEEGAAEIKRQLVVADNYVLDLETALRLCQMPIETHCSPRCENCEA